MVSPRPNYGITRIDQPEKKNHGYYVRITHRGKSHQKYFPDKASGGKTKALKAAKEHRDKLLSKMPKYKQEAASKKKRRIKQSGMTGVTHVVSKSTKGKTYQYWQAAWLDGDSKRKTAKFSISRYGNDKALDMAKKARRAGLRGKKK
ncbi:MAG: hypothetical protein P1U85_12725 [Verrucomicrobiales bacterium]|jgi:hypothetical protein|nr:hypothetical protein [Verrucomicrobiales bacterium]